MLSIPTPLGSARLEVFVPIDKILPAGSPVRVQIEIMTTILSLWTPLSG